MLLLLREIGWMCGVLIVMFRVRVWILLFRCWVIFSGFLSGCGVIWRCLILLVGFMSIMWFLLCWNVLVFMGWICIVCIG